MTGGACSGRHIAEDYFFGSSCRECHHLGDEDGHRCCQVLDGGEKVSECPEWQEVIQREDVRLYGPKYTGVPTMRGPRILPQFKIGRGNPSPLPEDLKAKLKQVETDFARPPETLNKADRRQNDV